MSFVACLSLELDCLSVCGTSFQVEQDGLSLHVSLSFFLAEDCLVDALECGVEVTMLSSVQNKQKSIWWIKVLVVSLTLHKKTNSSCIRVGNSITQSTNF